MNLRTILETVAQHTRTRRRIHYYCQQKTDPDLVERPILMGCCYENTRELSYDLYQSRIPHRIVYGGIAYDSIALSPTTDHFSEIVETTNIGRYTSASTGRVDKSLWTENKKPEEKKDIPDESNHYWVEVDGEDTIFSTTKTYHVEIAAEAREHYNQVFIQEGHPEEFYIKPDNCYTSPWERNDEWTWNPETLNWLK